ncbi:MAG: hypothetical protein ACE5OP_04080 [Candidatus Glassbacteria bacterium]
MEKRIFEPLLLLFLATVLFTLSPYEGLSFQENVEVRGFLLGNLTGRTTGLGPGGREGGDFILGEQRLRTDILGWSESVEASSRIRIDFIHDSLTEEFSLDLREAYTDYTSGPFDFRFGRQIATWGVGDLLFINDVFPKDWMSFFSGRPLEYLKLGVDGLRTNFSSRELSFDLVLVPTFTPDNLPPASRFLFFDPFSDVSSRKQRLPDVSFSNVEAALRLYRRIRDYDIALYAYRGFWRSPSVSWTVSSESDPPSEIILFYPELSVYGMSAQGSGLGGVLSFETGYYHSRMDESGRDPSIPNSQVRFLTGYQRQLAEDLTLGIQYYAEVMEAHSNYKKTLPEGFPNAEKYRDIVTLRLEKLLKRQTLVFSLFAFYSPVEEDYLGQPQVSYKVSDEFSVTIGANVFGGSSDTTFLGQFDRNDNVYASMRFDF